MSRLVRFLLLAVLLIGVTAVAGAIAAQQSFPTLPPLDTPTPLLETPTPTPTLEPTIDPGATAAPPPTLVPLGVEQTEALPILIAARADLELLTDAALGAGQRPVGWSGSIDVTDPQLPLLIRLDLETLAGAVMGAENRPAGWFGVVPSIPLAVARDIRHDMELLADVVIGAQGLRPAGWTGDDPIMRCSRATQSLFTLLRSRDVMLTVDFGQPNYCEAAESIASRYVERNVLQPPPVVASSANDQGRYTYQVDNPFVVAFLDRAARRKIGVLPVGTGFEIIGRSGFEFSNMMLIRGDGFQVFVDYTTTQIRNADFAFLPIADSGAITDCQAAWCGAGVD